MSARAAGRNGWLARAVVVGSVALVLWVLAFIVVCSVAVAGPVGVLVESESVVGVSSDAASLEGILNPQGPAGEWWVEYGSQAGVFDHSTAREPLAAGLEGVSVGVHVQGLSSSTVYHYRFVAIDEREGHVYTSFGQTLSFTTQPVAPVFSLLDGRAWEMVSPLDKHGASFIGFSNEGALNEAAVGGAGVTYAATASTEGSPPGEPAPEDVQVLSRHGTSGWGSLDIASPHEQEWEPKVGKDTEFLAFSSDLWMGVVEPRGYTLLGGASERTPYLRRQAACENLASAGECYLPLVTSENVTSGEKWGGPPSHSTGEVHFVAATPDLTHVVLHSEVPLTVEAEGSIASLYEWSTGRLELVSVLPGEPGATATCVPVSSSERERRHVISADGDRVVWDALCEGSHLYMHEAASHRTVRLDEVQGGSGGVESGAGFQDASADGSRVFFSDERQLTADSHASSGAPDLFVFEANADSDPEAGVVRDVTVPVSGSEGAGVLGVAGASADGSVVYVICTGVLSEAANEQGETAQAGQPNLYRVERGEAAGKVTWTPRFVATLSFEDKADFAYLAVQPTSVSADGRWLAFMSNRPLTGYDNRDAVSSQRDEEVFLYDGASRRLVCASCNPTGARPHGVAAVPGWDVGALNEGVYQPRYLSGGGRLFFDSMDALAPQDVNSTSDVYEYEPAGVGSCTTASVSYSSPQGGCIGLVSSGISSEESVFLDASESGNDVFFLTAGKVVAGDTDSAYDVYDAHVCGSGWECPAPEAVTPPCTNTASCQQAAEPQPSVFGAPPSATFSGAGNRMPAVTHKRAVRCRRGRVRRHGRCVRRRRRGRQSGTARRGRGRR